MTPKEISETANLSPGARALVRDDSTHVAYVAVLQQNEMHEDAVRFLAYQMGIAEGVRWGLACIRELQAPERRAARSETLEVSEKWTKVPTDQTRIEARDAYDRSTETTPADLLALAVFFSGGTIAGPDAPEVPAPPYVAQKLVAASVQMTVLTYDTPHAAERYRRAVALGAEFSKGAA